MDAQTILILAIFGGILLICALIAVGLLVKRTVNATVAGFSWFRKVFLEHYIWMSESSLNGFPAGSRNQENHAEHYQVYQQVGTDTTTSTVNGQTTTTSQPRYGYVTHWRTRYTYEIQQWQPSRALQAGGQERSGVHWPAYSLDASTQERVESREEQYLVIFQTARGKQYKRKLLQTAWADLDDQATYTLKVNLFGRIRRIEFQDEQLVEMQEQVS